MRLLFLLILTFYFDQAFLDENYPCNLPAKLGVGNFSFLRYFFNQDSSKCEKFMYRGSKGNANNFLNFEQCVETCKMKKSENNHLTTSKDEASQSNQAFIDYSVTSLKEKVCFQKPDTGPCKDLILSYFYSPYLRYCQPFFYGGCLGNDNRFTSWEECNDFCRF